MNPLSTKRFHTTTHRDTVEPQQRLDPPSQAIRDTVGQALWKANPQHDVLDKHLLR